MEKKTVRVLVAVDPDGTPRPAAFIRSENAAGAIAADYYVKKDAEVKIYGATITVDDEPADINEIAGDLI